MRQLKINKSITNRDAASLDKYLADISRLELITAEEEVRLAQLIRAGDQHALERLTLANLRFVVSVAKQYQNQGLGLQDLINEGNLGLIKAAKRFDESRGFKFISYAVWWIRQSIMQAVSEQSRMVRLPLNKVSAMNKIRKAESSLEQKLERKASSSELSEELGMDASEIELTIRAAAWHISTDASLPGNEDLPLVDIMHDPKDARPDDGLIRESLKKEIRFALSSLSHRESEVVMLFFGLGSPPLTLSEIAQKFDLTRERVRQIKEKAIRRLRSESRSKLLRTYLA